MTKSTIALLAPVPEEHLISGLEKCYAAGKIAFGSRAFQVFRDLDEVRGEDPVDVYIYGSGGSKFGPPKVRWHARYVGHVDAKAGGHPDGMQYRPDSTKRYGTDNVGHWAVFWEVVELRQLKNEDSIPMNMFRGWQTRKNYVSSFVPEGPILVEAL